MPGHDAERVPPSRLWLLALGYGIWCSALVLLYACTRWAVLSRGRGRRCAPCAVVLLVHLVALGWLWRDIARAGADFGSGPTGALLHWAVVATLITALVATVITLGPPLLLTACI